MSIEEEIRGRSSEIEAVRVSAGILQLSAFVQPGSSGKAEPLFVGDFDTSRVTGYSDRFFKLLFGLQEVFSRPVDVVEQEIFDREIDKRVLIPVSLEALHATA